MEDFAASADKPFMLMLGGGLDTETPSALKAPGCTIGSLNYEPKVGGGYQRAGGWTRYDGRPRPSSVDVVILGAATAFGAMTVGTAISGSPSGATGMLVYSSADLAAVIRVTGTFAAGDTITQSAVAKGVAANEPNTTSLTLNKIYAAAEDYLRLEIGPVPGIGPVRGLGMLYGTLYAFRDFDALTQKVYKATPAGWAEVPMLHRVAFTAGSTEYLDGSTLTKGGVTATIERVITQAGDWSPGLPASGWLVISGASGTFTAGAAAGGGVCTLAGAQTPITLTAGGRWVLKPYNFGGGLTMRLYGADGVNDLIEFDGKVLAPIPVSMPVKPSTIELHKGHVWASFGTSVQRSGIQDQYQWSVLAGSAELAMGDTVTGLVSVAGAETEAALLVLSKDKSAVIYGDAADYRIATLSTEVGAMPYSAQVLGNVVALDAAGARDFSPTQAFGNFTAATITQHLSRMATSLVPVASVIASKFGRYRLFLDDKRWLCGIPGKRWSWMFCASPYLVKVACEGEQDGLTRVYVGCEDGYVREMDEGRSFDGQEIGCWVKTPHSTLGAPGWIKGVRRTDLDVSGESAGELSYQMDVDYGDSDGLETAIVTGRTAPPASNWDSGNWDIGVWDGKAGQALRMRTPGRGEQFAFTFFGASASELPHELNSAAAHFLLRRKVR